MLPSGSFTEIPVGYMHLFARKPSPIAFSADLEVTDSRSKLTVLWS